MWVARCSIPLGQVGRDQPFLSASASVSLLVILTRERGAIHRHPNSFLSFYHPPTHTHTHTHTHSQQRLHLTTHTHTHTHTHTLSSGSTSPFTFQGRLTSGWPGTGAAPGRNPTQETWSALRIPFEVG